MHVYANVYATTCDIYVCMHVNIYINTYIFIYIYIYILLVQTTVKYFNLVCGGNMLFTLLSCLIPAHEMGLGARLKLGFQENLIPDPE